MSIFSATLPLALKGWKFPDPHTLKGWKLLVPHALKGWKFPVPHALKGQKLLAQGIALGMLYASLSPCFTLIEQALSVFFNVNYI